jgi:hypothetical protein
LAFERGRVGQDLVLASGEVLGQDPVVDVGAAVGVAVVGPGW